MSNRLWKSYSTTVLLTAAGESHLDMLTYDEQLSRVRVDVAEAAAIETAYSFADDFEDGDLAGYGNTTSVVSNTTAAAKNGARGMRQAPDGTTAGVASLTNATLPDGAARADVSFWFRQVAHTAGNSPILTIINRDSADNFDLFVNYGVGDGVFWWDMVSTDAAQAPLVEGQWYQLRVLVDYGQAAWTARVWIDGAEQQSITSAKAASDVRTVHFGGFSTDTNTRDYDDIDVELVTVDPPPEGATWTVERSTDAVRWHAVRGGRDVPVASEARPVDDYEFAPDTENLYRVRVVSDGATVHTFHDSITVVLDRVWLKNIAFPFLNRTIVVDDYGDVSRPARGAVYDVSGAVDPVAVTGVRGSARYDLLVLTDSIADADEFDLALSPGGVVYLQVPSGCAVPAGHYQVGDTTQARMARTSDRRVFTLPVTRVRPPALSVVGVTMTCEAVLNRWATCQQLLDTGMTCAQVLDLVAEPGEGLAL